MSKAPTPYSMNSGAKAPAEAPSGPWWKYGHMWMVVGGPLIVVIAAFVTLWLAIRTPDPVYTDANDLRVRGSVTVQPADQHGDLTPAMQARNHAATGGPQRAAMPAPAPGKHP